MSPFDVRKAVITAAGRGLRLAPAAHTVQKGMLPFVDRDGLNKPMIQIIAEEALDSGIEEICVICAPGDREGYLQRFDQLYRNLETAYEGVDWAKRQLERLEELERRVTFIPQEQPLGYGHAVYCAREFVADEPFLLLLGDHLYVSADPEKRCARQLIDLARQESAAVSAVHPTREHLIGSYGTVAGKRLPDREGVYQIEKIREKPSLSQAELELQMPGLRAGHYLCFFGMHILTAGLFGLLESQCENIRNAESGGILLTPALDEMARRETYLALEVAGSRYDVGAKFGLLRTQLALALSGVERAEALAVVTEVLAEANLVTGGQRAS